jgi:peptide/nickel transport system ATP-binding protein
LSGAQSEAPYLRVNDLSVRFRTEDGVVRAVDRISLAVAPGRTLGIVGESGSGKSVTALAILGLHDPHHTTVTGEILVGELNIVGLDEDRVSGLRGRDMAMIFQDSLSALHPYYTVGKQIAEAYLPNPPPTCSARRGAASGRRDAGPGRHRGARKTVQPLPA